jgi:hypothetical protein
MRYVIHNLCNIPPVLSTPRTEEDYVMNYTPEDKAKWEKVIQMMEETLAKSAQRPFFETFIRPL